MRCPTLNELPTPPHGKTGWPWTEASPHLSDTMPDGSPWPCISIVTPSYNQGQFIEETIRSVLLQGYPNLEYIIMDGGSADNSVEIIKRYEPWLSYWVSEPDRGQSHAINKGFKMANGQFVTWLNSDDFYLPSALEKLVVAMSSDEQTDLAYGICDFIDGNGKLVLRKEDGQVTLEKLLSKCLIGQAATLMRRDLLNNIGWLNEDLHFAMDWELWLRIFSYSNAVFVPEPLARCYVHENAKTIQFTDNQLQEHIEVLKMVSRKKLLPDDISAQIPVAISKVYLYKAKLNRLRKKPIVAQSNVFRALYSAPYYFFKREIYWPLLHKLPVTIRRIGVQIKARIP